MKSVFILSALLCLASAQIVIPECSCEPPICPLSLGAECRCKNAAAQKCYEDKLAQGIQCPKPTPKPCPVEARAPVPAPCECEPVFCPLELIAECKCRNSAAQKCFEQNLAKGIHCPSPTPKVCGRYTSIVARDPEPAPATPTVHIPVPVPTCGGFAGIKCPNPRQICVDKPNDGCDPKTTADCLGICIFPLEVKARDAGIVTTTKAPAPTPTGIKRCGFFPDGGCAAGEVCVDDQNDNCDPKKVTDCPGFCLPKNRKKCGFFPNGGCPVGEACVDDPTDKCDPKKISDCPGFCKKSPVA